MFLCLHWCLEAEYIIYLVNDFKIVSGLSVLAVV